MNIKQEKLKEEKEFDLHYSYPKIVEICRDLRKKQTKSEDIMWQALRNRQLGGLKFYRQHPFGKFVVDFYCHEVRLVVEVDGGIHLNKDVRLNDIERQKLIEQFGVRFFRCTNDEIENNLEGVLAGITDAALTPKPPLSGERGLQEIETGKN